jgi:hypothetical protein
MKYDLQAKNSPARNATGPIFFFFFFFMTISSHSQPCSGPDPVARALRSMYVIAVMGVLLIVTTIATIKFHVNEFQFAPAFVYYVVADSTRLAVSFIVVLQCRPRMPA